MTPQDKFWTTIKEIGHAISYVADTGFRFVRTFLTLAVLLVIQDFHPTIKPIVGLYLILMFADIGSLAIQRLTYTAYKNHCRRSEEWQDAEEQTTLNK